MIKKQLKSILAATLIISTLLTATVAQAKTKLNTYYIIGTIKNYTQTIQYGDGTTYTSQGIEIHDTDGNIWIWEADYNKDIDGSFKDGQKVKVNMNNHDTKSQDDDVIKSIAVI